ncbi:MAG: OmpA family protein [Planctomycetes bacterium]|nr:OmpA family protein [Planctomycetota bacterium]
MPRRKKPEEPKQGTAVWIVSFSDMVTLLLAFFVLLQTFAKAQDPDLFYAGQGSFQRAISGFGLTSWFKGRMANPIADYHKLKYPTSIKADRDSTDRLIDPNDERIREMFKDISDALDVKAEDMAADTVTVIVTPIRFEPSDAELNEQAMKYIEALAGDIKQSAHRDVNIYVAGLAADEKNKRRRWMLSARRAARVQLVLSEALASDQNRKWLVDSWGAGAGEAFGVDAKGAYVVIAIAGA